MNLRAKQTNSPRSLSPTSHPPPTPKGLTADGLEKEVAEDKAQASCLFREGPVFRVPLTYPCFSFQKKTLPFH